VLDPHVDSVEPQDGIADSSVGTVSFDALDDLVQQSWESHRPARPLGVSDPSGHAIEGTWYPRRTPLLPMAWPPPVEGVVTYLYAYWFGLASASCDDREAVAAPWLRLSATCEIDLQEDRAWRWRVLMTQRLRDRRPRDLAGSPDQVPVERHLLALVDEVGQERDLHAIQAFYRHWHAGNRAIVREVQAHHEQFFSWAT